MLTLYFHPLASYCWKVLIAFYENETPFVPKLVDLANADARAALERLWPIVKFPVLRDDARDATVPESTIIIEYLEQHYPGRVPLIAREPELAREIRLRDRVFDLYVSNPMQAIVGDRLRPPAERDPRGVAQARAQLRAAYAMLERELAAGGPWALGAPFTMADCAAAPALYYADRVEPLGAAHPHLAAYLARLSERPSFARTLREAAPYLPMFPTG